MNQGKAADFDAKRHRVKGAVFGTLLTSTSLKTPQATILTLSCAAFSLRELGGAARPTSDYLHQSAQPKDGLPIRPFAVPCRQTAKRPGAGLRVSVTLIRSNPPAPPIL